jgi:hypothetical protein
MKKIFALIALCTIGLTISIGYFYWQRASDLPEWYTKKAAAAPVNSPAPPTSAASSSTPPARSASTIQKKLHTAKRGAVREQLTAAEIDNLIVAGLIENSGTEKTFPKAVKGIKTQIQQDQIRTGAIVDIAEMEDALPHPRTEMMSRLVKIMPQLRGKPVYIGLVGQLSVKDGQPQLSDNSKLQVGKIEFSLNDVAQQLGVSRSFLEQNVTSYLRFSDLNIETIDLTDQGALITGKKK